MAKQSKHLTEITIPNVTVALPDGWETVGHGPVFIKFEQDYFDIKLVNGMLCNTGVKQSKNTQPTKTPYWRVRRCLKPDACLGMSHAITLKALYPDGIPAISDEFESTFYVCLSTISKPGSFMLLPSGDIVERTEEYCCGQKRSPRLLMVLRKLVQ
jgi:hypothetical protein